MIVLQRALLVAGFLSGAAFTLVETDAAFAQTLAPTVAPSTFEKNASQYCFASLSAADQSKVFSRMMNLGASYSHGCTKCDASDLYRKQLRATEDQYFVRRNFLAHFLNRAPWKDPNEFKFEFLKVLENDVNTNLASIYTPNELKNFGYDGKWAFEPNDLLASRLSQAQEKYALSSPGFKNQSELVGTGFIRRDLKSRDLQRSGTVYQSVPGRFAADGARQKLLFDLAADTSSSFEIMKFYGDEKIYQKLLNSGWTDLVLREQLITKTVSYLRSFQPSSVFAVDSLFWDAVPNLFENAIKMQPKSIVSKVLATPAISGLLGLKMRSPEQQQRMAKDTFEVLARLSRNNGSGNAIPVFVGRLIDAPGKMIREKHLEKEFGALLGSFIEMFTGRDLSSELADKLKSIAATAKRSQFQNLWKIPVAQRFFGSQDQYSSKELSQFEFALSKTEKITENGFPKPVLPWFIRGAVNAAILDALNDLPLLLAAADKAFEDQNSMLRAVARDPRNNIQLINVDEFYGQFQSMVNAYTLHPSTKGAAMMADLVEESLCNSVGPNP